MTLRVLLVLATTALGACGRQGLDELSDLLDAADGRDAEAAETPGPDAPPSADGPPSCELGRVLVIPPDPACGALPAMFGWGCSCGDSITYPECRGGRWICQEQPPRLTCGSCGGGPIP